MGTGLFGAEQPSSPEGSNEIALGDMNSDGVLDVVSVGQY